MAEISEVRTVFVIRFPTGGFSQGPSHREVSFKKAKFWNRVGDVKNHLAGTKYPEGTEVLEVELSSIPKKSFLVSDYLAERAVRKADEKISYEQEAARRELKVATERLKVARERLANSNDSSY